MLGEHGHRAERACVAAFEAVTAQHYAGHPRSKRMSSHLANTSAPFAMYLLYVASRSSHLDEAKHRLCATGCHKMFGPKTS